MELLFIIAISAIGAGFAVMFMTAYREIKNRPEEQQKRILSTPIGAVKGHEIYRVEYEGNVYLLSPNIGIIQHSSQNRTNIEAVIKSEYELGFFHGVKAGAHAVHVAQAQKWDDNNDTVISNDAVRFHNVFKSLYPGWKHINTSDLEKTK